MAGTVVPPAGAFALVTGASEGIGKALAERLGARGLHLALTARSEDRLRAVAAAIRTAHGVRVEVFPVDLADAEGPPRLVAAVRAAGLEVDVLVNNAGFGNYGPFGAHGLDRERRQIALNVAAPVTLAAELLPSMRARGRGLVVNVASTAAVAPVPWLGSYAATKAFLASWTRALGEELRGTGVHACLVCPGTTRTRFQEVSGAEASQRHRLPDQSADAVADETMRALDRGRTVVVTGLANRVHAALVRLLPLGWVVRVSGVVMRPRG